MAKIKIETQKGDIVVRLYDETPKHRDNMLKLIGEGYYDGTLFHRVIKDFMIQGGDPESKGAPAGKHLGAGGPDYTIEAEIKPDLFHKRGAVAAARESDNVNPERESSASQFYIVYGRRFNDSMLDDVQLKLDKNTGGTVKLTPEIREAYKRLGGTPHLDGQYTVFGEVIEGLETVDSIQWVETDKNDRPIEDIKIIRATVIK